MFVWQIKGDDCSEERDRGNRETETQRIKCTVGPGASLAWFDIGTTGKWEFN